MPGKKKQFRIFGAIVSDDSQRWSTDDVTPAQFANFLKFSDPEDEIELMINSPGGGVTAGIALANMVKSAKQKITARVYGIAASMASVVASAATELVMYRSSFMMIHNPWALMMGDSNALKKEAAVLDSMKSAILDFYRAKFPTLKDDELSKMMDEETWMLGAEASAFGLRAVIEDDPALAAACVKGPAMFAKIPDAAKKFYAGDPSMRPLPPTPASASDQPPAPPAAEPPAPVASASLVAEPPAPPEPSAAPVSGVVALSQHAEELALRVQQAEALADTLTAQVATLTAERDSATAAASKAEEQRRDHQSKADRLAKELEQARAEHTAAADKSAKEISSLAAEKGALEQRIAAVSLNALGAPNHACAQTWDEAIQECGSYEAAKAKYPHLAEAYRLAHTPKGDQNAAD
jgi:ATP-dependent protease ClpP protease subunit/HAMP domain-containing protein